MNPLPEREHQLQSIDQNLMHNVIQAYQDRKADGLGEMAARNAAVMVLSDKLPGWTFRAASEMVSRIIALSGKAGQPA